MRIESCRSCKNKVKNTEVDLGILSNTGYFPLSRDENVFSSRLDLVRCESCDLVQLGEKLNTRQFFAGDYYGYASSLNNSMSEHLKRIANEVIELIKGESNALVLDIGSNDGTFLNHLLAFRSDVTTLAIDPTLKMWEENYRSEIQKIPDFFTKKVVEDNELRNFNVVTTLSMFYDLENPIEFAEAVASTLKDEGFWILEQSYLPLMIKNNSFDTICHEHLEYYNLTALVYIFEITGFAIINVETNGTNGGSIRLVVQKTKSKGISHTAEIKKFIDFENAQRVSDFHLKQFMKEIISTRRQLGIMIDSYMSKKQKIIGLGASTKGNTLLQYCGLTSQEISHIEEINPSKHGRFTPGSLIPITLEDSDDQIRPQVKLVLPWHFRTNIESKQKVFLSAGGELLFPLPELTIVKRK